MNVKEKQINKERERKREESVDNGKRRRMKMIKCRNGSKDKK